MKLQKTIPPLFLLACCSFPASPVESLQIDPFDRWQVRDFYQAGYHYGMDANLDWAGNYLSGDPGFVSGNWLEATRARINYYRVMAGVPGNIIFDPVLNDKCQHAALMMSVNGELSHEPPENWLWWTQEGFDAASNGNIAIGSTGQESIDGYMADFGAGNFRVGHRRWILYPRAEVMGSGDVPGNPDLEYRPANALWVFSSPFGPRTETRDSFVAWPPKGYVPVDQVYARWSFSLPEADFTEATVTMTSGGEDISVAIEPFSIGTSGDPAIVWVAGNLDTEDWTVWPLPAGDQQIEVSVSNVLVAGQSRNFSYTVTVFDPYLPGNGEFVHEANIMGKAWLTAPVTFQAAVRPWAEAVQGRVFSAEPFATVHDAEGGQNTLIPDISPGYNPVQTERKRTGTWAFHLVNPDSSPQLLAVPGEFLIGAGNPVLEFDSSLAYASQGQYATVEINTGSGNNWQVIWHLSGPVQDNNSFTGESIDLSPWTGHTARFRFRYDHIPGTQYYPQTEPYVGWAFDNVRLLGLQKVLGATELPVVEGSDSFSMIFEETAPVYVQSRSLAFDSLPLDWGPVLPVVPEERTTVDIPDQVWTDDALLGLLFGFDGTWEMSPVFGFIQTDAFPWLFTTKGWIRYVRGSLSSGLWLYHEQDGFIYTEEGFGQTYLKAPFDTPNTGSFRP